MAKRKNRPPTPHQLANRCELAAKAYGVGEPDSSGNVYGIQAVGRLFQLMADQLRVCLEFCVVVAHEIEQGQAGGTRLEVEQENLCPVWLEQFHELAELDNLPVGQRKLVLDCMEALEGISERMTVLANAAGNV